MKRLLAVILVLGMASTAEAVIIDVEGRWDAATVTVIGEDTSSWLGYLIVEAGASGTLSNAQVLPGAGDLGSAVAYVVEPDWGVGYELTVAASPMGAIEAGPQFKVDYSCTDVGWGHPMISLYIDPEYEVPAAEVTHWYWPTPEYGVYIQVDGKTGPKAFVSPDTKALITVVSDRAFAWLGYILVDGSGELSNPVVLDAAGNLGSVPIYYDEPLPWSGYELTVAMSPGGIPPIAAGPQFNFDYSYSRDLVEGTTISLYVDPYYEVPADSVEIIPEPMTVLLLGLGALVLHRRR